MQPQVSLQGKRSGTAPSARRHAEINSTCRIADTGLHGEVVHPVGQGHWVLRWVALLLSWLLAPTLATAQTCSGLTYALSPAATNIIATSSSGIFYRGNFVVTATGCQGSLSTTSPKGFYVSFSFGTTASAITGHTAVSIQATGATTHTESGCTWNGTKAASESTTDHTTGAWDWTSGTCNVTFTVPFALSKAAGSLSTTLPVGTIAYGGGNVTGCTHRDALNLSQYGECFSSNQWLDQPFAINIVPGGCTLAVTNTTVALPSVAKTALAAAGSTAGKKPFTLSATSCISWSGGTYPVSLSWSFTPLSPFTDVIANSAGSPAANVGVQLLDSTGASIANGGTTLMGTVPTSGGATFSKTFYAQYYATGAAGSGGVVGAANITLSYQ